MATQVQIRKGTTAQHASFTGAVAELSVDTDKKTVVVHDGSTAGGVPLVTNTRTETITGTKTFSNAVLTTSSFTNNPTLSGGTANGVAYLNGSKVVTTGSALTFDGTNLAVGSASAIGGGVIGGQGDLSAVNGFVFKNSAAAYGNTNNFARFVNSAGSSVGGLTHPAITSLGIWGNTETIFLLGSSGATEAMRLTSTGLGIGTSSPGSLWSGAYKLVVGSGSGASGATIYTGTSDAGTLAFADGLTGNDPYRGFVQYLHSSDAMLLGTSGTTKVTLDSSGNLGLGVTPNTWFSTRKVIQLNSQTSAITGVSDGTTEIWSNSYITSGGTNTYVSTGYASVYQQNAGGTGVFKWFTAPSGTAGTAITFTQAMTLDASGNLGIGTSSPGYKLQVYDSSGAGGISLRDATYIHLFRNRGNTLDIIADTGATGGDLRFFTNGITQRAIIDSSGNLGLGVTPSAWSGYKVLQIGSGFTAWSSGVANARINANTYYNGGYKYVGTGTATMYEQDGYHAWYTAASGTAGAAITFTQAMTLNASGNLGVGETSPASGYRLHVKDGTCALRIQSTTTTAGAIPKLNFFHAGNDEFAIVGGSYLAFLSSGNTERARIDSSGNLLVGKTSATNSPAGLWLLNSATDGGQIRFSRQSGSGTQYAAYFYESSGGLVGSISTTSSATAYNTSSDYRLKDNQALLTGSGAFIDALKPKTWNWKIDGSKGVGFIAHEVQEVSPSSVVGEKDGEQMQAMEYGSAEFIANIVAELQSLRARVAALES